MNTKTQIRKDVKFKLSGHKIILNIHLERENNFHIELLDIIGNKLYRQVYKERDYICEHIDLSDIKPGLLYFRVNVGDEAVIKELINHKANENYIM